jgi:hypothetical protein
MARHCSHPALQTNESTLTRPSATQLLSVDWVAGPYSSPDGRRTCQIADEESGGETSKPPRGGAADGSLADEAAGSVRGLGAAAPSSEDGIVNLAPQWGQTPRFPAKNAFT